jgi:2-dehydro-3-deoxyphosphogluconate aldolase/(4S)-4-hydroxy-2-oxoglutarate aldolase
LSGSCRSAARQCRPPTEIVLPGPSVPGLGPIRFQGAIETGYTEPKFFPAEAAGGANYLKSVSSPIPAARFCPTGAISTTNAASYLTVLRVGRVGGSWITPSDVPAAHDWARITELATAASRL